MARKPPADPISFSAQNLPEYERHLLRLLDRVMSAVEGSDKIDVSVIVWDYSWYFSSIRAQGTREASAYVETAHGLWEAVVDIYHGDEPDKPHEELVSEFALARATAFAILLPHFEAPDRKIDEALARFLRLSDSSPRPMP
ncbi:hypothetical protein G6L37_05550 [Agrobacterium rubi]|nr:hypothetical protein [Agrobacterium rubi]NTF24823.1 hypothetical protein [Agrobacterium rubi]